MNDKDNGVLNSCKSFGVNTTMMITNPMITKTILHIVNLFIFKNKNCSFVYPAVWSKYEHKKIPDEKPPPTVNKRPKNVQTPPVIAVLLTRHNKIPINAITAKIIHNTKDQVLLTDSYIAFICFL